MTIPVMMLVASYPISPDDLPGKAVCDTGALALPAYPHRDGEEC